MKVLITGGAGFIGSHLAERLSSSCAVRILDDLSTGNLGNLRGCPIDFRHGSILDERQVSDAMRDVDCVFHLAGLIDNSASMNCPERYVETNVMGTLQTLKAASKAGVGRFVFASSAAVYGMDPSVPKVETMPPSPATPYAQTKLDGEFFCRMFAEQHRLSTACVRFFNVFGPRQSLKGGYSAVIPSFISNALTGKPLVIHGDGTQTRDFVFVQDISSALAFLGTHSTRQGIFNCGYGSALSIAALAREILTITASTSAVTHSENRQGDIQHSVASIGRLQAEGWNPDGNIRDGLRKTVEFYRAESLLMPGVCPS